MIQRKQNRLSAHKEKVLLSLLEQEHRELATKSMLAFTLYTMPKYEINWHHQTLCSYLDRFVSGEIKRLMVFMPPRHGKSELVSRRMPAYLMGKDPNLQVIAASYSDSLASQMSRDVQKIIDSNEYKWIFPGIQIGQVDEKGVRYIRNASMFEMMGKKGRYKSAGIGTGITGLGANVVIIDDPVKDQTEVNYVTQRDRAWEWYTSVLSTRLEKDARVLLTMTRWHEDDLAGRLLKAAKDDPAADQWVILNLPAVREEDRHEGDIRAVGEPLWENKYPRQKLDTIKASIGSKVWNALYQQRPSSEHGNIIQREWFQLYDELPKEFDEVIQSWDLTFKQSGSSWTVGQVWGRKGANKYLLDQFRKKIGFVESIQAIKDISQKWPEAYRKIIEDAANGPAVIETLNRSMSGIIAVRATGSKESRANAVAAQIEAKNVYLPKRAHWVEDYLNEWVSFPNGADDDQVDATTQALIKLEDSSIMRLERMLNF